MSSAQELINQAQACPLKPVIDGLLNENEVAGLHGPPEVFKTTFCLQLAEALTLGRPFLGMWQIPRPRQVYFLETEMNVVALGDRLHKIFMGRTPPAGLNFADNTQLRAFRRAPTLADKFALLSGWVSASGAEVVILDTANPFFRGKQSPNDETTVGEFFDRLDLVPCSTKLFVRHNHKRKLEDDDNDAAGKIRGSGQFADVPDLLLELRRTDKRTNEATFSISKFRGGSRPDDMTVWFDSGDFRLISIPPVIHLLQAGPKTRTELTAMLFARFGLSERSADAMILAEASYLSSQMRGHSKVHEIAWEAANEADWFKRLSIQTLIGRVGDLQGCISSSLSLTPLIDAAGRK